jgi:hypothetical protein
MAASAAMLLASLCEAVTALRMTGCILVRIQETDNG